MPIFEYTCRECGHRFEALVFGGRTPDCPECGSRRLEKLLSVFGVGGSSDAAPPTCPTTGGG